MWLSVLGALSVRSGDGVFRVPAARQRVILAALAIRAGKVVSFGELAEAIWDDAAPAGSRVAVRNYVCRLRQVLGPAGERIVTAPPGYFLDVTADEVDLLRFTRDCRDGGAAARAWTWREAWDVLGEALALWQGPPLLDVPSRVLRDDHVPALESLRLRATQWRLDAGLHLGKHSQVALELQALAREHPLHEGFRAQLMLALYRCGQQADALLAYQEIRQAHDYAVLGDFDQALAYCGRAAELLTRVDNPYIEACTWHSLAYAYHQLGDTGQAVDAYLRSAGLFSGVGERYQRAVVLGHLGDTYYASGDIDAAGRAWRQGLDILDALTHPNAPELRAKLRSLAAIGM